MSQHELIVEEVRRHLHGVSYCPVCEFKRWSTIVDNDRHSMGLSYVMCDRCGFVFMNPAPSSELIGRFYKDHYRKYYHEADEVDIDMASWDLALAAFRYKSLLEPVVSPQQRILEIGPGTGALLRVLACELQTSGRLEGIEPNARYAKFIREHYGIAGANPGMFVPGTLPDGRFDGVVMIHALEHVLNPRNVVEDIWRILKPGGWFLVEVPDLLQGHDGLIHYHIAHVSGFSREPLFGLLRGAGFIPGTQDNRRISASIGSLRVLARRVDRDKSGVKMEQASYSVPTTRHLRWLVHQASRARRPLRRGFYSLLARVNLRLVVGGYSEVVRKYSP